MPEPPTSRPPLAVAMEWTSRITSIALEMVVPIIGGHWLDRWLGTRGVLMIVGVVLGFVLGMSHLLKIAKTSGQQRDRSGSDRPPS